jgi:hypothetical protein
VKDFLVEEFFATLISFACLEKSAATAEEALNCLNHILTGVSRPERLALSEAYKSDL